MASLEDREAKICLAKEKLKKFQKKRAAVPVLVEDSSAGSLSLSLDGRESLGSTTRSSPSLESLSERGLMEALAGDPAFITLTQTRFLSSEENYAKSDYNGLQTNSSASNFSRRVSEDSALPLTNISLAHSDSALLTDPLNPPVGNSNGSNTRSTGDFDQTHVNNDQRDELKRTIADLLAANSRLKKEVELERNSIDSRILKEHQNLREQLNGHIQTIGILVAEKTELQAGFTQAELTAKKKAAEADNYASKLSDLHAKITQYERQITDSHQTLQKYDRRSNEDLKDMEDLRSTNGKLQLTVDQLRDEVFESQRRLNLKDADLKALQEHAADLTCRLESAKAYSGRLEVAVHDSSAQDLHNTLLHEKKTLESKVQEYQTELARLQQDMELMVSRYQSLLAQVTAAKDKNSEAAFLQNQLGELTTVRQQLEETLRNALDDKEVSEQALQSCKAAYVQLTQEKDQIESSMKKKSEDTDLLGKKISELEHELVDLRSSNANLTANFSERQNLLSTMESDKVALSRAMTQNSELKGRLEQLTIEVTQQTAEIQCREEHIRWLQTSLQEAQSLQHPLQQTLTEPMVVERTDSALLKAPLTEHVPQEVQTDPESSPASPAPNPVYLKAFEAKVRNLEDEIQMYKSRVLQADSEVLYLKNALRIRDEEAKLLDLTERVGAYRNLEQRFVAAMKQNAQLLDQIDQLEHIIMQLQGETETIGDYIALYQSQRGLQRQRDLQKNSQIETLFREREELKDKLIQLQRLVKEVLERRQLTQPEHMHINLYQSGDVPDTPVDASKDGQEVLEEYVMTGPVSNGIPSVDPEGAVMQLLEDIDQRLSLNSSAYSAPSQYSMLSPNHPLYCNCCVGDLKVV